MDLPKIYMTYGSRPVIAYGCQMVRETPMGGYVIAVQNNDDDDTTSIKEYMRQLKEKFSEKEPIHYICIKEDAIVHDNGLGEVKSLPEIMEKKPSKMQRTVEGIPDDIFAKALASSLKKK